MTILKEQEIVYEGNKYSKVRALEPARTPLKDLLSKRGEQEADTLVSLRRISQSTLPRQPQLL